MTFTSWQFGVFAAIVFAAYYLPALRAFQVQLLVFASLFFYGYGQPELLALLAVAVFGTYLFLVLALRNRQVWLPVGVAFNLALLAFFKYKLLFIDPASPSLVDSAPLDFLLKLPLPIGISFFVFHNISLLVDLTRQKAAPPTLASSSISSSFRSSFQVRSRARKCSCRRSSRNISRTFPSSRPRNGS
jgi:alginate O-acetyltransferase complex protein AlgI